MEDLIPFAFILSESLTFLFFSPSPKKTKLCKDCIDWTQSAKSNPFTIRINLSIIRLEEKIYVMGGQLAGSKMANDVWVSGELIKEECMHYFLFFKKRSESVMHL